MGDPNSALTIHPRGEIGPDNVGYGLILSGFQPGREVRNLDDATRQLVASIQETNPALKPVRSGDIRVASRNAKSVEFRGISSVFEDNRPLPERVRMVVVPARSGLVLYLLFVAPEHFEKLRPTFDRMLLDFYPH